MGDIPFHGNPDLLERIEFLELRKGIEGRFLDAGITHVGELVANTRETLRTLGNIGRATLEKVERRLEDKWLGLSDPPHICKEQGLDIFSPGIVRCGVEVSRKHEFLARAFGVASPSEGPAVDFRSVLRAPCLDSFPVHKEDLLLPVEQIGLSTKVANLLKGENIDFVGELVANPGDVLSGIDGLGAGFLKEIEQALGRIGFVLPDKPRERPNLGLCFRESRKLFGGKAVVRLDYARVYKAESLRRIYDIPKPGVGFDPRFG